MLVFIDETGKHHSAIAEVKETKGVNGEKSISGSIFTNDEILEGIGRGWRARFNGENYCLTYAYPIDEGKRIEVEFDAVHEFFFDMKKSIVHDQLDDGSHTFKAYLDFIFKGSGYEYALEVSVAAFEKQSFGFKNRLTLFNDIVSSTGVEFSINGRIVRILNEVGTDLSTIVKKGFNMNELKIEKDIGSFITVKKGYGAYLDEEDHSKGRLTVEYVSPLADIYGRLEGEPVMDERYTVSDNLLARLKNEVESSYGISVTLDMEDLTQAGYEYEKPHEGDYIMAINEDLKFSQKIRIKSYTTQYDTSGTVLDHEVSCGSDNLVTKMNSSETAYKKDVQNSIDAARNAAENAWRSADNKNTIYYGSEEPQGSFRTGDTWYQVDGEQVLMKYWNGYEWVLFFDPDANYKKIEEAFSEAEAAKEEAENAYKNAVKDAESKVNEASSEWENKLETAKEDFSTGIAGANSAASNAQQKAETAHQEAINAQNSASTAQKQAETAHQKAIDAANQADTNSTNIVSINTDLGKLQVTVTGEGGLTSKVSVLDSQISGVIEDVSGNSSSIVQLKDQVSSLVKDVDGNSSSIVQINDQISTVVSDVSGNTSNITQMKDQITSIITDVSGNSSSIVQLDDQISSLVQDVSGNSSMISQLSENILLKVSTDELISSINLSPETIRISGKKIQLDGDVLMNSAWINKLYADSAFISKLSTNAVDAVSAKISNIITTKLDANTITSEHLKVDNALFNKIFAEDAFFTKLVAKDIFSDTLATKSGFITKLTANTAFINKIKALDIDASRITTGILTAITISGENLSINLSTGKVRFTKGEISSDYLELDIDQSYLQVRYSARKSTYWKADATSMKWSDDKIDATSYGYGSTIVAELFTSGSNYGVNIVWKTQGTTRISAETPNVTSQNSYLYLRGTGANLVSSGPLYQSGSRVTIEVTDGLYFGGLASSSSGTSLGIISGNKIVRITSAKKYKEDIQNAFEIQEKAERILLINPKSWQDKAELKQTGHSKKYFGFIADDFDELGLSEIVIRDNSDEIESLMYERISIYHQVLIQKMWQRIENLETQLEEMQCKK